MAGKSVALTKTELTSLQGGKSAVKGKLVRRGVLLSKLKVKPKDGYPRGEEFSAEHVSGVGGQIG